MHRRLFATAVHASKVKHKFLSSPSIFEQDILPMSISENGNIYSILMTLISRRSSKRMFTQDSRKEYALSLDFRRLKIYYYDDILFIE